METETSDVALLDILRKSGPLSVAQLATAMRVTATAVRQRLARLQASGDIERAAIRSGRGRPVHRYALTEKGHRRAGANFADLAVALWQEVRAIKDAEIRRGLLNRISQRLVAMYAEQVTGEGVQERMEALTQVFAERRIPFDVDTTRELPTLRALACPYPELAEQDRSICAMERMLFSELVGDNLRLTNCRLDGSSCCTFEPATN